MRKRVLFGFLAVLLVVSSILLGCKSAQTTTTTTPTTTTTTTKTTTATTPAANQPKQGGTLRIPIQSGFAGFDPQRKASGVTQVSRLVFSNLVQQDPTKADVSMTSIVPDLAQSWEISADQMTYTFHLVQNAKWHDGTPLTADDVVYSFQKMMDPTRSLVFQTFSSVSQVVKVDDNTVKIVLNQPYAPFLVMLASPYSCIEAKSTANIDWKSTDFLMGTGPFKLKSYTSGVSIELVKNTNYFKKDQFGIQLPYLDDVQITIMPDQNAETAALISNRLDIFNPNGVRSDDNLKMMKDQAPTLVVDNAASMLWPFIAINQAGTAPLKDPRVRQAMVMLADQKSLVIATYGSESSAYSYNNGIFTPQWGNPPDVISKIMGWDKTMEQRIIDAQALMRAAGYYPQGFKITIPSMNDPGVINGDTSSRTPGRNTSTSTTRSSRLILPRGCSRSWVNNTT